MFGLDHLFQVECRFREEIEEHVKKGLDYLFPDHEYSKLALAEKQWAKTSAILRTKENVNF